MSTIKVSKKLLEFLDNSMGMNIKGNIPFSKHVVTEQSGHLPTKSLEK